MWTCGMLKANARQALQGRYWRSFWVTLVLSLLNPHTDGADKAGKVRVYARAKEFRRRFPSEKITKILTIESSGIGIACIAAQYFHVPVVFAKKAQSINIDGEIYHTKVESFTHKKVYDVIVSKKFLGPEDHVLVIDDFLANGCALMGLISLIRDAGATIEGAGIVIEKGFQQGGKLIREAGIHLESLAVIDSMTDDSLTFR